MGNRYSCKYTFEEWCVNNDRQDILNRWDYEKNDKVPSQVAYRTRRKHYFKTENSGESKLISVRCLTTTEDEGIYKNADSRREDLTGKKFGELTVIELDEDRTKNTDNYHSYWLCKCSCGNIISVTANRLKMGQKTCNNAVHRSGENSPGWKGGITSEQQKNKIISRVQTIQGICP